MYNKVILVGNLSRDIELRYSQGGMGIAKTAIATSRKFSNNGEKKEEVCFVDITFFGRSAEVANQYLRKGSKVLVDGRLVFQQWTAQDGSKKSKHAVSVETLQMLDTKADSQNPNNNNGYGDQPSQNNYGGQNQNDFGGYNNNSYNAPEQGYGQPQAPRQPTPAVQPQRQAPVPEIDIDDDEIPF